MNLNRLHLIAQNESELIAQFGEARLVKHLDGRVKLIGGTEQDRGEAREWCSMFLDAAVDCGSGLSVARSQPRQSARSFHL